MHNFESEVKEKLKNKLKRSTEALDWKKADRQVYVRYEEVEHTSILLFEVQVAMSRWPVHSRSQRFCFVIYIIVIFYIMLLSVIIIISLTWIEQVNIAMVLDIQVILLSG